MNFLPGHFLNHIFAIKLEGGHETYMNIKKLYLNLSIKHKILIFFYGLLIIMSVILGVYAYLISHSYVISKVSSSNINVLRQINTSINFLQKDIVDISTYLAIDPIVLSNLKKKQESSESASENQFYIGNSMEFITNIIASKDYISCIMLYGNRSIPIYYQFTDTSTGANNTSAIKSTDIYKKAASMGGAPLWFIMDSDDNTFIQNNAFRKIALCRIIKDYPRRDVTGFMIIGINESIIRELYMKNIQDESSSFMILDESGQIVSQGGPDISGGIRLNSPFIRTAEESVEGYIIDKISGREMLIAYSKDNVLGWKLFYAVPVGALTREVKSIKTFTVFVILACLFISLPLILLISSFLTAPIKRLLESMKNFQKGNFNEKVDFKYSDEIGKLGEGYNNMVTSIRELIRRTYMLQLKEREAELNALQAQINPHFLYNTLDTIYWKSQKRGETEISEMIFSLAKLFRLSLNRGKGLTTVASEKELIEHYLSLQKMRFKEKLNYRIEIDGSILPYIIPKLIIQPFVENAILHGLEKKEGGGTVKIQGRLEGDMIHFTVEDDGVGISRESLDKILQSEKESNINMSGSSGGYAVRNVDERLKLNFNNNYTLDFVSNSGTGTRVDIIIPLITSESTENSGGTV